MDECTYRENVQGHANCVNQPVLYIHITRLRIQRHPFQIMGKMETVVESKERIIPATFHVIKGDTKTEPLLWYGTAEKLRIVTIYGDEIDTVQTEKSDSV